MRRASTMARQVRNVWRYGAIPSRPLLAARHVLFDREVNNFTYQIENADELAEILAAALHEPSARMRELIRELDGDDQLRHAIEARLRARRDRNRTAPYGRRLGWYATARICKPRLVVETGTHDGLGSAVILRALELNAGEGVEGRLISIDLDPRSGWLVPDELRARYEQRFEDSVDGLASIRETVDLAVLDSAHVYDHELRELELLAERGADRTVVISDNPGSHAFGDFCSRRGLTVSEFWERPRRHIHPGAGLALARL
jgi:predicted O-methyltransferase YrrM